MSVRLLESTENDGETVMYCSTTNWAFGPIMPNKEIGEAFLRWLEPIDARELSEMGLRTKWISFSLAEVCECGMLRIHEPAVPNDHIQFVCNGCQSMLKMAKP